MDRVLATGEVGISHDHEVQADTARALIALLAGRGIAEASIYLLPLLAGSIVEGYGVSTDVVGYIMAAQLAGLALASLGLSPRFPRLNRHFVLVVGLGAAIVGNLVSALGTSITILFLARIIVGLGEGAIAAVINGVGARTRSPHRTFSILTFASALFAVALYLLFILWPGLLSRLGVTGTFVAIAAISTVLAPFVLMLPQRTKTAGEAAKSSVWDVRAWGLAGTCLLLAWALFQVGQNGLWTYVERIGHHIGLGVADILWALVFMSVSGVIAPILAGALGDRLGRVLPITIATFLSASGSIAFGYAQDGATYLTAGIVMTVAIYFVMPYIYALSAEIDPKGRVAAAVPGFVAFGSAIGPAAGGFALGSTSGDYSVVAILAGATTVLSYFFLLPVFVSTRVKAVKKNAQNRRP